jgi:hypothetical protein
MPSAMLSLTIVCNAFPAGEQARALGIWAGISAVALGIGPLAGGALIDIDWRLIFWVNLPIAAFGVAIMALAEPESTDPGSGRRVDLSGLVTLGAGLTALVLALAQARVWSGGVTALLALLGTGCLYAFWGIGHRAPEPIVDFSLFRNGPYFGASAAAFALVGAYWSVTFFQSQYLQDVRGHSAVLSGSWLHSARPAPSSWLFVRDPPGGPRDRHAASSVGRHRVTHWQCAPLVGLPCVLAWRLLGRVRAENGGLGDRFA